METYKITRLGLRGEGVAEGPVYAVRALPGELIEGVPQDGRLKDFRIIESSEARVTAPCRHYKTCGGCQMQHASDAFVAEWKTDIVRQALKAHGLEPEIRSIVTSPAASRRRATFAARRTKNGALAGFHRKASDVITDVPECQLLTPELLRALPLAEDLARLTVSRKGQLEVAVAQSDAGLDVAVYGGKSVCGSLRQDLSKMAAQYDLARLIYHGEVIVTRRTPFQTFDGISVCPPPNGFLQATKHAEKRLQGEVKGIVAGAGKLADLFSGCGTFALPLAKQAQIHAVETDHDALASLDTAWRHTEGLKTVSHEVRDLFRNPLRPEELCRFDAVVLDPPRAGAQAQTRQLAASSVPVIAYVSCNPSSFAKDAKCLVDGGYKLKWVRPIDQFRWSAHVELVASFEL